MIPLIRSDMFARLVRTLRVVQAFALVPYVAHAQNAAPASPLRDVPPRATAAIVDVTVVPMDRSRVIEHQTVVVRDGRIAQIGATSSVAVPAGAQRIDGRGKFLMPGLVDMHAHFVPGSESM